MGRREGTGAGLLRDAWERHAEEWIAWARAPGHDAYWRFHRDAFLSLVPPPGHLTIDVGCGEGRLTRDLTRIGHRALALDASPTLARAAMSHWENSMPVVLADAAQLPLLSSGADCVVAFMSLQDIDHWEAAISEIARILVPGGRFIMATTHPVNTAGEPFEERVGPGPDYRIARSWFDRAVVSSTCERDGFSMTFHSEHRPLQAYADALADAGFLIERIREPTEPDPNNKWHSIPLFLHIRAVLAEARDANS